MHLPFRKFLRLSKPRSWTGDPEHEKYRSISLGPLAHAGFLSLIKIVFLFLIIFFFGWLKLYFHFDYFMFLLGYQFSYYKFLVLKLLPFVYTSVNCGIGVVVLQLTCCASNPLLLPSFLLLKWLCYCGYICLLFDHLIVGIVCNTSFIIICS